MTLLQNKGGTLLGDRAADTLVPLGQLVEILNCKVHWAKGRLTVIHPVHGRLRVRVRDFCPELAEHEALKLIAELEQKRLDDMTNTMKALELKVSECEYRIPMGEKDGWLLLKSMPWSRRKRRTLFQSQNWNLHLFAGPTGRNHGSSTAAKLSSVESTGPKVDVDIRDSNLMDVARPDGVYKVLLWAAANGRLRTIIGGPPRRSYLALDPERRAKEQHLVARMLVLGMVAAEGRKQRRSERVGFALEHPDALDGDCLWTTSMWAHYAEEFGMDVVKCGRGATGTNLELQSLRSLSSSTTPQGTWTDGYVRCIENAVVSWNGFPLGETVLCYMLPGEKAVRIGKMTAKEWQLHVQRDHLPFRRDCRHCVQAASGRPHRRVMHRSAYVLSADVAGPFRTKGRSTDTNQHKFMLVCAYQFPRLPGTPEVPLEPTKEDDGGGLGDFFSEDGEKFADPPRLPEDVKELAKEWSFSEAEEDPALQGEPRPAVVESEENQRQSIEEELSKEEREAMEASEPFEFSVAYFIRPLRSRRSGDALRALQEVYIDLKMMGLPVNRLHADRAREFRTPAVAEWAASRDVQITRTEGDSPAQNGAAEQAVKYVKSRTRILLSSAQELTGKPMKEVMTWWPMAAEAAVERQRALAFGQEKISPAGFGNKVFVKRKRYGVDAKDLDPKWGPAIYLGPARDVPGGHVVLTEDNHLWNTCNVRRLPDVPMEPDPSALVTRRRILGKRPPVAPVPLKALRTPSLLRAAEKETIEPLTELLPVSEIKSVAKIEYLPSCDMMKPLAQISHERQWYSLEDCFAILEDTPFRKPNKTRVTEAWGDPGPDVYMTFGAYQHGSFVGLTNATREYSQLVTYLTAFVRNHSGTADPFTSLVVARNLETGLHRDRYNVSGRRNIVISCGTYEQGGLWVEGVHEGMNPEPMTLPDGKQIGGSVIPTKDYVVKFNPRRLHKSLPWEGTKWTIIAYVNRGFARLPGDSVQELRDSGFLVPQREEVNLHQLRLQDEYEEFDYCTTSDEEELALMGKAVAEDELVLLRSALDEEEKLEMTAVSSEFLEETNAVIQANVGAMMRCARLEAVAAEEFQRNDVDDAMEWFRLCRMVEGDEQHGAEEVLRNLQAPLQVVSTRCLWQK